MGGVAGALASHADRVMSDLGPQRSPLVRAILLRLVTAERTRAVVPLAELRELSREDGEVQRADRSAGRRPPARGADARGGMGTTVEIVHESLVHGWPTLRRWFDENQDDVALVEQLRAGGAPVGARRAATPASCGAVSVADEARTFRARYKGPLSDVERGFLEAVVHQQAAAAPEAARSDRSAASRCCRCSSSARWRWR